MSEPRGNKLNLAEIAKFALPNSLTLARLIVGIFFFWLPASWRLGAVIFAGLSDLVDGWISRYFRATSVAGKILDPIADKTCVLAVIITLLYDGKLRFWELLLVAQREIIVVGSAIVVMTIARHKYREMPPRLLGKVATAGQFVFLIGQLAADHLNFEHPPRGLFIIAAVLSGLAGLDYLYVAVTSYRAYKAEDETQVRAEP